MPDLIIKTSARGSVSAYGEATALVQILLNTQRGDDTRAWFVFEIPAMQGAVLRASLRMHVSRVEPLTPQIVHLHVYSGDISRLITSAGEHEWQALTSGTPLAQRTITPANAGKLVDIPLSPDAGRMIASTAGKRFAIGAAMLRTSENPPLDHLVAGPMEAIPDDGKSALVLGVGVAATGTATRH